MSCPLLLLFALALQVDTPQETAAFELVETTLPGVQGPVLRGVFEVYENRALGSGRILGLDVVVLPALSDEPAADPIFQLAGGPGQAATGFGARLANSPLRRERDIVMVDQRGTGGNHRLACSSVDDPQRYLGPVFDVEEMRACLAELQQRADLTQYSTGNAMDDLDDVRAALGYERINLIGGSYGTRAALIYMRRHPEHVRSAVLNGVAPISFKNPLFHARAAQDALDRIVAECAGDPDCNAAFPELAAELEAIFTRLTEEPADVDGLTLTRDAFAETLRTMTYYSSGARAVPLALHRAFEGDFSSFVELGLRTNRSIRRQLAFGMLLCVTCAEDVDRIDPDSIPELTAGTYLGDGRVRRQIEVCSFWPRSELPEDAGEPVRSAAPTLLLSGELDPVTPPSFGAEAASHLPNSLHLVVPASHGVGGACIGGIIAEFLDEGSVAELELDCVESMRLPAFSVPASDGR